MKAHQIYCLSCQKGKTMIGAKAIVMKNGSPAIKATCPTCDNTSYRIVRKDETVVPQFSLKLITLYITLAFGSGISIGVVLTRIFG